VRKLRMLKRLLSISPFVFVAPSVFWKTEKEDAVCWLPPPSWHLQRGARHPRLPPGRDQDVRLHPRPHQGHPQRIPTNEVHSPHVPGSPSPALPPGVPDDVTPYIMKSLPAHCCWLKKWITVEDVTCSSFLKEGETHLVSGDTLDRI